MKRKDFFKRICAAFAALVAWVKVNEGITEPIQTMHIGQLHETWSKTFVCRDGVNWEEVTLPGKSVMQKMRDLDELMKNDPELQFVALGKHKV